jgi:hypothetical protein
MKLNKVVIGTYTQGHSTASGSWKHHYPVFDDGTYFNGEGFYPLPEHWEADKNRRLAAMVKSVWPIGRYLKEKQPQLEESTYGWYTAVIQLDGTVTYLANEIYPEEAVELAAAQR